MACSGPLIVPVAELQMDYFHGIKILNDKGEELADEVFERYLRRSQAWLEKQLGITLAPCRVVDERHRYVQQDFQQYIYLNTYMAPIISVEEVKIAWPGLAGSKVTFPASWLDFDPKSFMGRVQMVPQQDALSAQFITSGGQFLPLMRTGGTAYVPGIMQITYTGGFKEEDIPEELKEAVAMRAAMGIFDVAGDLIVGAGIASKSISIPGLSQSVSTTSSATNAGYGARIGSYKDRLDKLMPMLRSTYGRTMRMVVA